MPNPSLVRRHKGLARHSAHQLLHLDLVRFVVARARFEWFSRTHGVQTLDDVRALEGER